MACKKSATKRHQRGKPANFRPGWYCRFCRAFMEDTSARGRVLKEYPGAWFNAKDRAIEGYSEGLILGRGSVNAKSIEASAWAAAAKRLRRVGGRADG